MTIGSELFFPLIFFILGLLVLRYYTGRKVYQLFAGVLLLAVDVGTKDLFTPTFTVIEAVIAFYLIVTAFLPD